ncbi:hypothetical protein [Gulosibacter macacae]|uniref:hypothetical protein n=1 Tax=Gulosibacter macacae TaxID=2488791 RepID=UPI00163AC8D1|nr:hypothetical protein [Gulosibacter macacae]
MTTEFDTEAAPVPTYGLILEFAETELVETKARADEAVRTVEQLESVIESLRAEGVEVRGFYDLTGFGDFGTVLVWLRATSVDDLQWAQRQLQRTQLLGDTVLARSRVVAELTELDEIPGSWINVVDAVEALDDDFEVYGVDGDELDDDALHELEAEQLDELEELEETDDDEDYSAEPGSAMLSLHASIGIGDLRYVVIAEAEAPIGFVGELGLPFGDDLALDALEGGIVGRHITSAELFEVLR